MGVPGAPPFVSEYDELAILRRCVRCGFYKQFTHYSELGKICNECMSGVGRKTTLFGRARGLTITPLGRETLRQMREQP